MKTQICKTILISLLLLATQNTYACSGAKSAQCWWSADNSALLSATALPNMCLNQQTQAKKCYEAITDNFNNQGDIYQAMKAKLKSNGICGTNGTFRLLGEVGTNGKKILKSSATGSTINVTCP